MQKPAPFREEEWKELACWLSPGRGAILLCSTVSIWLVKTFQPMNLFETGNIWLYAFSLRSPITIVVDLQFIDVSYCPLFCQIFPKWGVTSCSNLVVENASQGKSFCVRQRLKNVFRLVDGYNALGNVVFRRSQQFVFSFPLWTRIKSSSSFETTISLPRLVLGMLATFVYNISI